ncbi:MAG: TIGR00341 family protein, partial [Candidatus Aenigmarchaeota archaeon]|nr:TIGR00341 family protein [Candidatus Aenigmarchaeota archaeon]
MLLKQDFFKLEPGEKGAVVNKLIAYSSPSYNFFLMFLLSIVITTLGLLVSSPTVVIGGMLIAPVLYPILSLSMGVVTANFKLIKRSCLLLLEVIIFSVILAFIISLFITNKSINFEILTRTRPSMIYFFIAFVSGIAASYALSKPKLSEVLPGVAIAVSVLPPLAVCGIALAFFEWSMAVGAFSLFFLNIIGIIFASIIVFSLLGFYEKRRQIDRKIEIEERIEEK